MWKRLWAFVACCLLASAVHAQQVLFLSPDESVSLTGSPPSWALTNNAYNAFAINPNVVAMGGIVDGRRRLSQPVDMALFTGIKLVVLTTTYNNITADWRSTLANLMLNRPDLTFVMFPDGCCNLTTSLGPLVNVIQQGTGWTLTLEPHTQAAQGTAIVSPLNANSLYKGSFAGLPTMAGSHYQLIQGVPADNALYLAHNAPAMPAPGTLTSAYGLFVPQQGFNNGNGACMFLVADINPFSVAQSPRVATAFMDAATNPNGACKQATRAPDVTVSLTGPTTVDLGAAGSYSMTLSNLGATASTNGTVAIPLPAGFTASGLPANCSVVANTLSCNLSALAATTGTATLAFQGTAQQPGPLNLTATVSGVTGETNTANNAAAWLVQTQAPDLSISWGGSGTGTPGVDQPFSLTVSNAGPAASQGGTLTINLPTNVTVDPASLPANCSLSGSTLTCALPPLAAGANVAIAFTGKPTSAGDITLTAALGVPFDANTGDNTASLTVQVAAPPAVAPAPVPSLGAWALALLAATLAAVPALRRRPG